jgi:hypothetical protein
MNFDQAIFRRVRQLPGDERGNVLLLSGMMAFAVSVMALFVLDTNKAVQNRMVSQNAVDGAAEEAALTQARGLNLLQHLNNFHYAANWTIFGVEEGMLAACLGTPFAQGAEDVACTVGDFFGPEACAGAEAVQYGLCETCSQAGPLNNFQGKMAQAILDAQAAITKTFPILELSYANEIAAASGGGDLKVVVPEYAANFAGNIGIPIPNSIDGSMFSGLPTINAYPINSLNPLDAVSLHTQTVNGSSMPWKWPDWLKYAALGEWETGKRVCQNDPWQFAFGADWYGSFDDHDGSSDWGWDDQYYAGHPGFMTWMAGTTNHDELAGLGYLRWLKGNDYNSSAQVQYFMNQENLQMYTGAATNSNSPLIIPAFIALASSQVEGNVVIDHGNSSWAVQTLIPVYFPQKTPGTQFYIYH